MKAIKDFISDFPNIFFSILLASGFVFLVFTAAGLLFQLIPALSIQKLYDEVLLGWLNFIGIHPVIFWLIGVPAIFFIGYWLFGILQRLTKTR